MTQQQPPYPPPPYYAPPPKRNRGLVVLIVVLVLVLIAAVTTGTIVLLRANNSTDSAPEPRTPEAVQFRRVLTAESGACPTPATDGTFCDAAGMRYTVGPVELDGRHVSEAKADNNQTAWVVTLTLDSEGARIFNDLTKDLSQQQLPKNQLAIVVRDKVISAPTVQSAIPDGKVQITGNFSKSDAEKLADDITG
jgi:preprotein translocase subunit SecD